MSEKDWNSFETIDPFNPQNFVTGLISRNLGSDYGSLVIENVNGIELNNPQKIYCTPKMHYPFNEDDKWIAPEAQTIERYIKLDGTNIFAFSYNDSVGNKFVSYKTRLRPFLSDSKFGPFTAMWNEIMQTKGFDSHLVNLIKDYDINLSFELYGGRNPHLIQYSVPLASLLLFGRKGDKIIPPEHLPSIITKNIPTVDMVEKLDTQSDYMEYYKRIQDDFEADLSAGDAADTYIGDEGEVWYLLDVQNNWTQFKLKPHLIEKIHWANGGIGKNMIIAACYKAVENWDSPTINEVIQVLSEDYTQQEIDKIYYGIEKNLSDIQKQIEFKNLVLAEYKILDMNILANKKDVMRSLSTKFKREDMKHIFSIIMSYVGE